MHTHTTDSTPSPLFPDPRRHTTHQTTEKSVTFEKGMAKQNFKEVQQQARQILTALSDGRYAPLYLLMGEEGFYTDKIANFIATHALTETEREFNQTIVYGKDTDGGAVVNLCRRYPMMSQRQVVIVREAQALRNFDALGHYAAAPLSSTVLVLCYKGKSLDKRSAVYKQLSGCKGAVVLESTAPRDYEMDSWIRDLFASRGCKIEPKAVQMIADHLGTELQKIDNEVEKLFTRLPEGTREITATHIEQNIGISKDFNNFELTHALSERNMARALTIVEHFAADPKGNPLPVTLATLFNHFQRIVTLGIAKWENQRQGRPAMSGLSEVEITRLLKLPAPFFAREYITASANYPNTKVFTILGWLREYDMKSKGMNGGSADPGELLRELILRIATI